MKKKAYEEFKAKPSVELEKARRELKERLANLKMDLARGKVKNIKEIKHVKKSIAQILTILANKH